LVTTRSSEKELTVMDPSGHRLMKTDPCSDWKAVLFWFPRILLYELYSEWEVVFVDSFFSAGRGEPFWGFNMRWWLMS